MIFLRIDNISSELHAGVFKIYAKCFWFSTTAFFCNIYMITIKQFSPLFFIDPNFIFVNKCYAAISYETLICNKMLDELRKALNGC